MLVKRLGTGDELEACKIVSVFRGQVVSAEYMGRFLSNGGNYLIVAYDESELIGYVLGYKMDRIDRDSAMVNLYEIEVLERHRRKGAGKRLIEELERICTNERFMKMFIITNESNNAAMALYNSVGGVREWKDDVLFNCKFI